MKRIHPPIEWLRVIFDYDPATGAMVWRWRPREHFDSERGWRQRNGLTGKAVGWRTDHGALQVIFKMGSAKYRLYVHRVAWALHYGCWPEDEIDHRDGDGMNNRIDNLRLATRPEQMQNLSRQKGKEGRLLGAYPNGNGFCSRIKVAGEDHYLGQFASEAEAHAAYLEAKARLHPFQPIPRL